MCPAVKQVTVTWYLMLRWNMQPAFGAEVTVTFGVYAGNLLEEPITGSRVSRDHAGDSHLVFDVQMEYGTCIWGGGDCHL